MADPCIADPAASDATATVTCTTILVQIPDIQPADAGSAFAWAFSAIVSFYLVALGIGKVLRFIEE